MNDFLIIIQNRMFDPLEVPDIFVNPILRVYEIQGKESVVLLNLQNYHYVAQLSPFTDYDELALDRLKITCRIAPIFMTKLVIPELQPVYMKRIPFEITSFDEKIDVSMNIRVLPDIPLIRYSRFKEFVREKNVEIWKIFIFWYLFGVREPKESMLFIRQGNLISKDEKFDMRSIMKPAMLQKYFLNEHNVDQARKEILDSFSLDDVRGILFGTQEPLREIKGVRGIKLSTEQKALLHQIEMRHETLETIDIPSLVESMTQQQDVIVTKSNKETVLGNTKLLPKITAFLSDLVISK